MRHARTFRMFLAAALAAVALALAPTGGPVFGPGPASASEPEAEKLDRIVLQNGRTVEGRITRETDTEVEITVLFKGIEAPTVYKKSDVLAIERGVVDVKPAGEKPKQPARGTTSDTKSSTTTNGKAPVEGAPRIYLMELEGDFGWTISKTSLQAAFDDAMANDPAAIIVRMDCGTRVRGFNGLFVSESLVPVVEKVMKQGVRVIFWIERAQWGAAFLPFISPEIYFHSEGRLGGVGDLGDLDLGDDWVNEKQISLRLGHAEGLAIQGGYHPALIRAMARKEMWLAVRWEGGEPIYLEHEPRPQDGDYNWEILSDDGKGKNKDEFSFEGNDVLNLDADLAYRLRVSRGTYDKAEDLAYALGLGRDFELIKGRADRILKDWSDRVERAVTDLRRLRQELAELKGQTTEALGQRKRKLEQMRSIFVQFGEVLDPEGQQASQIDVELEMIRQQHQSMQERERARDRSRNTNRRR